MVFTSRILEIHHHPTPTRGHTMKFVKRPDLDSQTRIHIVMLAWLHQGVYGKMTELPTRIGYPGPFSTNCF
jgi:hypothetical protein